LLPDVVLRERFRLDVSAASGLVVRDGVAHVIADDGERLRRYRLDGARLPDVPAADDEPIAKRHKPDFEALLDRAARSGASTRRSSRGCSRACTRTSRPRVSPGGSRRASRVAG